MDRKPDPKWAKPPPEGQTVSIEVYKSGELVDTYKLAGEDVECVQPAPPQLLLKPLGTELPPRRAMLTLAVPLTPQAEAYISVWASPRV